MRLICDFYNPVAGTVRYIGTKTSGKYLKRNISHSIDNFGSDRYGFRLAVIEYGPASDGQSHFMGSPLDANRSGFLVPVNLGSHSLGNFTKRHQIGIIINQRMASEFHETPVNVYLNIRLCIGWSLWFRLRLRLRFGRSARCRLRGRRLAAGAASSVMIVVFAIRQPPALAIRPAMMTAAGVRSSRMCGSNRAGQQNQCYRGIPNFFLQFNDLLG